MSQLIKSEYLFKPVKRLGEQNMGYKTRQMANNGKTQLYKFKEGFSMLYSSLEKAEQYRYQLKGANGRLEYFTVILYWTFFLSSSATSSIVTHFLKSEKVTVLKPQTWNRATSITFQNRTTPFLVVNLYRFQKVLCPFCSSGIPCHGIPTAAYMAFSEKEP